MGSPAIFSGLFTKFLKSQLNLNDAAYVLTGSADPTSVAQTGPAGSIYMRSNGSLYIKQDAGSSTNWTVLTNTTTLGSTPKSGNYTLTPSDAVVLGDASGGAFTLTLPAASSNTGRVYYLKKIDSSVANQITIARTGSDTIDGATSQTLGTQYEDLVVVSDGTNWQILERRIPSALSSATLTLSAGFGTTSLQSTFVKRTGDSAMFRGYFKCGTVAASVASFTLPSGYVIDTTKLTSTSQAQMVGWFQGILTGTNANMAVTSRGPVFYDGSTTSALFLANQSGANVLKKNNGNDIFLTSDGCTFEFTVPIVGWGG